MKPIGPDDEIPEGFSYDWEKPKYRSYRESDSILEYTLEDGEVTVDWVQGKNAGHLLRAILDGESHGVEKITGYTTRKLANVTDEVLLRLGQRWTQHLGGRWPASIERRDGRRYLVLRRENDEGN